MKTDLKQDSGNKSLSGILNSPFDTHPQKLYTADQVNQAFQYGQKYLAEVVQVLAQVSKIDGTKEQIAKAYHNAFVITNELTKDF